MYFCIGGGLKRLRVSCHVCAVAGVADSKGGWLWMERGWRRIIGEGYGFDPLGPGGELFACPECEQTPPRDMRRSHLLP